MNTAPYLASGHSLAHLSDAELLAATRQLVGRTNQLLAALLAHLVEVEARGIHRSRACSSLYTYCIYELRWSEDEAYRRVAASRLVRRFPALLDAVACGELHLTGLLMLGPHLTEDNLLEVLGRAKHRTKKEIARLVRVLDPLPDVPARIEPLGPAPARVVPEAGTWAAWVGSMVPVRDLAPGDRPRDWMASSEDLAANDAGGSEKAKVAGVALGAGAQGPAAAQPAPTQPAPARLEPQRYRVEFTATEEYVKLVEAAKALLARSSPRAGLEEIHLHALRALVTELNRQKHAVTSRPRKSVSRDSASHDTASRGSAVPGAASESAQGTTPESEAELDGLQGLDGIQELDGPPEPTGASEPKPPRQRGRYVPAALRRTVFERDAGRCTYIAAAGERCRETHGLELHHVHAYAQGGEHSEDNLTLRCRAHNLLAAEEELGRDFVEQRRDSLAHEPFAMQVLRQSEA